MGGNGTGKTTLLREIMKQQNPSIVVADMQKAFLSQLPDETIALEQTIQEVFEELGLERKADILAYLEDCGFTDEMLRSKVGALSGGERGLLQLAKIAYKESELLLLDEPTSHLDLYSQRVLEKAIRDYGGTVLMVSHDFYTIVDCMDYVLLIEDKTIRRMSIRKFRQMIYADHFDKNYLELEQKKKDLELKIELALQDKDFVRARLDSEVLAELLVTE